MIASERETVITYSDEDNVVEIFTCIRKDITAMSKKDQFEKVASGSYADGTLWARFRIDRSRFDIARSAKGQRKNQTEEQRQASAERLALARERKRDAS